MRAAAGPSLADVRITELVGSMAVQTVETPTTVSLEAPKAQTVPGVVNFYSAVLNLGQLTCKVLLKEYPTTTRSLGVNEIRIYGELVGPQDGFFTDLLQSAAREMEGGQQQEQERKQSSSMPAIPPMYAAFEAYLVGGQSDSGGPRRLQSSLLEEQDEDASSSSSSSVSPSVWLAFRYGEHGTATLLDFQAAHVAARQTAAKEEWLRRTGSTTDDYRKNLKSVFSILMPFERVPIDPAVPWANYVRAAMRGSLEALASVHSRGVAHGSLSGACLLVNTVAVEEAAALRVQLYNFGYAGLPLLEAAGSGAALQELQGFREDLFNLGLAFSELLFPEMAQAGTDFRRVIVDVYGCNMSAVAEFVQEEEPWGVALLSERQGAGWELLRALLAPRDADAAVLQNAASQLLSSCFFDDSY